MVAVGAAKDAFTAAASTLDRGETETNNEDGGTDNQALILVFLYHTSFYFTLIV